MDGVELEFFFFFFYCLKKIKSYELSVGENEENIPQKINIEKLMKS